LIMRLIAKGFCLSGDLWVQRVSKASELLRSTLWVLNKWIDLYISIREAHCVYYCTFRFKTIGAPRVDWVVVCYCVAATGYDVTKVKTYCCSHNQEHKHKET
jgi:hypothetical protein